mgnify:CR=1 FL=1
MKFSLFTAALSILAAPLAVLAVPAPSASGTVTVSYDPQYDNPSFDLLTTACSDGTNGLVTKGYSTAGSLPSFPRIGGAFTIPSWNSPNCGKCYSLTYNGNTIYVTAVDHAADGFNIAEEAMNQLTGGQAVQLGRVSATYADADPSQCGF